jgi:nickel-dependent lactate racemase
MPPLSALPTAESRLAPDQVQALVAQACPATKFLNQRVLLIIPDSTRTAPVGLMFRALHDALAGVARQCDLLVALGTHQPMTEAAICRRLEITAAERDTTFRAVRFHNHAWNQPTELRRIGVLPQDEIRQLSQGLFALDVPVDVNRLLFDYDRIILLGPVFPHEVVGFSGGNKYLFPGVAGPDILNFFHWLGAVITTPRIIGHAQTPVRRVIDRAAAMVDRPILCFALVVAPDTRLAGLFAGTPEDAWAAAVDLSRQLHITVKDHPYQTILSCAPAMYDEIWTAGKCMYKLEPVLADGGELIIYAPHIAEISFTHGKLIETIGYHCRDYFLNQWERFQHLPWGVLAHSAHVHGLGTFDNGIEVPRARVTLATQIPETTCRRLNLGYRDPRSLNPDDFAGRESEGVLLVPKAGELLYRLAQPPSWAIP